MEGKPSQSQKVGKYANGKYLFFPVLVFKKVTFPV